MRSGLICVASLTASGFVGRATLSSEPPWRLSRRSCETRCARIRTEARSETQADTPAARVHALNCGTDRVGGKTRGSPGPTLGSAAPADSDLERSARGKCRLLLRHCSGPREGAPLRLISRVSGETQARPCGERRCVSPTNQKWFVIGSSPDRCRAQLQPRQTSEMPGRPDSATPPAGRVLLAEPLLTASDVARLLVVPQSSVYEYARRRHDPLPCMQIGRHRRFYRSAIEDWLARQAAP